jgi:hypothetical protein
MRTTAILVTRHTATLTAAYLRRLIPRGQAEADQLAALIDTYEHPTRPEEAT